MAWRGIRPSEYAIQMIEELETDVKRKIIVGLETVIRMSPVMDGAYRGNHRLTVNRQDLSFDPSKIDKTGGSTLNTELSNLVQFKIGDVAYIQNNAPYAMRLENGWSDQNRDMYAVAYMNIRNA